MFGLVSSRWSAISVTLTQSNSSGRTWHRRRCVYPRRVSRDIGRKFAGDSGLKEIFAQSQRLARRVREQRQRQRGPKVYSLHAPEVECIGRGKAHRSYGFGVKVSGRHTIAALPRWSVRGVCRRFAWQPL
jgi:hypothetical protein